jgi:hypothetical protein
LRFLVEIAEIWLLLGVVKINNPRSDLFRVHILVESYLLRRLD